MPGRTPIPHYYLYGRLEDDAEAEVELDFLHIEPIRKRSGANDWTIEPHAHPHHMQVLYVGTGGGVLDVERRSFAIGAPCLMTVPVATVHQLRFQPGTDGWVVTAAEPFVAQAVQGDARLVEAARARPASFPLAGTGLDPDHVAAASAASCASSSSRRRAGGRRSWRISSPCWWRCCGRRPAMRVPRLPVDDRSYALVVRYRDLIERPLPRRAAARVLRRPAGGDAGAAERRLPGAARHHRVGPAARPHRDRGEALPDLYRACRSPRSATRSASTTRPTSAGSSPSAPACPRDGCARGWARIACAFRLIESGIRGWRRIPLLLTATWTVWNAYGKRP